MSQPDDLPRITGLQPLATLVFQGGDVQAAWDERVTRTLAPDGDLGALLDLSMLLQLTGDRERGLAVQADILEQGRLFRRVHGAGQGKVLLALMAPGDFMANTPLDFMLEGSDFSVVYAYLGGDSASAPAFPPHDLTFVAIGESEANRAVLDLLATVLPSWPRPVVNGRAERIAALSRDAVFATFRGSAHVASPPTARATRSQLLAVAAGAAPLDTILPDGAAFPIIARPIASHAGVGLSKLDSAAEIAGYLSDRQEADFYVSPFVDYRGADGQFRKYRIALIDGRPYLSHLAISSHWMVHYLNAGMQQDAAKRDEEGQAMADFDSDFAVRHRQAFDELAERVGLDYFAIDCAEAPDGRLLLFEADVAMIVHAMDPPDLYPYKPAQMRKLFEAFQAMLARAATAEAA